MKEPARIAAIRRIVRTKSAEEVDGLFVDLVTASAILSVYDALKEENKRKYAALPILKMVSVTWKLVGNNPGKHARYSIGARKGRKGRFTIVGADRDVDKAVVKAVKFAQLHPSMQIRVRDEARLRTVWAYSGGRVKVPAWRRKKPAGLVGYGHLLNPLTEVESMAAALHLGNMDINSMIGRSAAKEGDAKTVRRHAAIYNDAARHLRPIIGDSVFDRLEATFLSGAAGWVAAVMRDRQARGGGVAPNRTGRTRRNLHSREERQRLEADIAAMKGRFRAFVAASRVERAREVVGWFQGAADAAAASGAPAHYTKRLRGIAKVLERRIPEHPRKGPPGAFMNRRKAKARRNRPPGAAWDAATRRQRLAILRAAGVPEDAAELYLDDPWSRLDAALKAMVSRKWENRSAANPRKRHARPHARKGKIHSTLCNPGACSNPRHRHNPLRGVMRRNDAKRAMRFA